MKCGVYKIQDKNGRLYIGSSIDVSHRLLCHRWNLRKNKHANPALQNSWNKHGEEFFIFQKILTCSESDILFYEQIIMDFYKSNVKPHGYNSRIVSPSNAGIRRGSSMYTEGDKFGRLTLIGRVDKKKYKFLCDCGKTIVAFLGNVAHGNTSSCGCLHNDLNSERYTKVRGGDKYNKITLIRLYEKRPGKNNLWLCRCDCGIEKIINVNSVVRGGTKSCGCIQKEIASKLRGVMVRVNDRLVSCAEAERIIGIHKGGIHSYYKRNKVAHQEAVDYYIKKLSLDHSQ